MPFLQASAIKRMASSLFINTPLAHNRLMSNVIGENAFNPTQAKCDSILSKRISA